MPHTLKSDRRAALRRKTLNAPRGATRAGQLAHTRTARGYRGSAKKLIRKHA